MIEDALNSSTTTLGQLTLNQWGILFGIVTGVIALAISKYALTISKRGVLPDIEFQYKIKAYDPKQMEAGYQHYFYSLLNERYQNMYSHLILFNGGNGKASNIDVAYNWCVSGRIGGVNSEVIKEEEEGAPILVYVDYLFPGQELVIVPTIDLGSDVFEEAEWILIRVQYNDSLGGTHCKCAQFVSTEEKRGFGVVNSSQNYCGRIKRHCKVITRKCSFVKDVCSTEDLQIPEEDKEAFKKWQEKEKQNEKK